jgi:hypothetical protein
MKIMYLLSFLLLVGLVTESIAQSTAPQKEFTLSLSENELTVKPGTSSEFLVTILRSKSYTKSSAKLGFSSVLPEGISITFQPSEGIFETSTASVVIADTVKPGKYQIIVNAKLNNTVKGSILKVVVADKKGSEVVSD